MSAGITVADIVKQRRPRRGRWLVAGLVVMAGAAGLWWYAGQGSAADAGPAYATAQVARGAVTVKVTAVGTVQPIDVVTISSELSGTIRQVAVAINDRVTKGQVLAMLDTSALQANLARDQATLEARKVAVDDAAASLTEAELAYDRAQKMADRGVASQESLTLALASRRKAQSAVAAASAEVKVAGAAVMISQSNLDKACICAPMDGIVLDSDATLGKSVGVSGDAVLFTLAQDLSQMELQLDVDEADIGKVAVGDPASFTVEAYQGQTFPAEVSALRYAPQTIDGVVTYPTLLSIDNAAGLLRPGMTASAEITVDAVADALLIPNAALRYAPPVVAAKERRSGLLGMLFTRPPSNAAASAPAVLADGSRAIWVLRDKVAVQVGVMTGMTDGDFTQVVSGDLAPGDQVITGQAAAK